MTFDPKKALVITATTLALGAGLVSIVGAASAPAKTSTAPVILQQAGPEQPASVEEPAGAPDNDAVEQGDQGGPDNEAAEGPETGAQDGPNDPNEGPEVPDPPAK